MTKILVVDDAADNAKLLACNLEDEGYAVATASDGPEALRLARTEHPDLMLLDIMMPGMDGTEVCRQVKADPELKDIPIIMVTAKHLDEDVVKGLDAGADDYVSKPVHNDILAARLRSVLRVKESRDAIARINRRLHDEIIVRRRTERALRKTQSKLRTSNRSLERMCAAARAATQAKSQFLADMCHEIRTPLTAILGYADLLQELDLSEADRLGHLQTIRRNGGFLLELLNDILDVSKIEANRIDMERIPCSPSRILADVVSLMRARAESKGLTLSIECRDPLPETILADPTRLRQILVNLVGNALKFTEIGGVRIVAQLVPHIDREPVLRFDVIDTGVGMTAAQQAMIFHPFAQADSSTSRKYGGTGLGLTISKRLASLLGGDITVVSELGKGSEFQLTIAAGPLDNVPLLAEPRATTADTVADDEPSLRLPCRILVAEDSVDIQNLLVLVLRKAGVETTIAQDGQEAVEMTLASLPGRGRRRDDPRQPFDMILMDIRMPVMDGYEATRRLRQEGYAGPIIALSADTTTDAVQQCLDAGCTDYLAKPVDRDSLLRKIVEHATQSSDAADSSDKAQESRAVEANAALTES